MPVPATGRPIVLVINSSPDTVEMLRLALETAEMTVLGAYTFDIRDGQIDLSLLMNEHKPQVVIYDIAPPYDRNWHLFQHLRETPAMRDARFVITSTNARQVHAVAGADERVHEIIGKPYDLGGIVEAVRTAMGGGT